MHRWADARRSTDEIDVVASDRAEDIDEALTVIHDGFVESGYIAPRTSGRRLHPSYLNPGTIFVIARIGGTAVGACLLIADGPFGLPSDRAFAEENDAMRAEGRGRLAEGGSLSVAPDARRHTRRIVARMLAALTRTGLAGFPHSPVVMAVAPETARFYQSLLGAGRASDVRPLYGAPAVLLRTSGLELMAHCARRESPLQRQMDTLLTESDPAWLFDRRAGLPLPAGWLAELLAETGTTERLEAQRALLGAVTSAAPPLLSRPASSPVAA